MEINTLFVILISTIFINNYVLSQMLGLCPFLGVSKKLDSAIGMGLAVIFVMGLSSFFTFIIYKYVLVPFDITYLTTIAFILIIAGFVQFVEMVIEKVSPVLYYSLGIFLPLITTNCVILGVAILVIQKEYSLLESVVYAVATAIGYAMALVIFSSIREQLALTKVPKAIQGIPVALITAGIMAMAFMGFSGIDQVFK